MGPERTEMEFRPGPGGGPAGGLVPRTRQMLTVLWSQLCSQLRLLLQLIYYSFMSVFQMFRLEVHVRITDESGQPLPHMGAAASPPDSFLFSSLFDGDGGVMVGGPAHISNFCGEMGASPAEALLCCGLVDELAPGGWKVGFAGDWNLFCSGEAPRKGGPDEGRGSPWSSEEDQNPFEFDDEESQKLWESLSGSADPYNPLFFTAVASTAAADLEGGAGEVLGAGPGLVSRSDSESSWGSSDGSALGEDAERLLEFFASSDPYDPMCFTACSGAAPPPAAAAEDEEEERLWTSLSDPYHPPNFQARPQPAAPGPAPRARRPALRERPSRHRHPDVTTVPWAPPRKSERGGGGVPPGPAQKKVRFSPVVRVHVMRSWLFARQASRRGPWEEMARDRDRFRRRIRQAEATIGPCLSPAHRRRARARLDVP